MAAVFFLWLSLSVVKRGSRIVLFSSSVFFFYTFSVGAGETVWGSFRAKAS